MNFNNDLTLWQNFPYKTEVLKISHGCVFWGKTVALRDLIPCRDSVCGEVSVYVETELPHVSLKHLRD